MRVRKRASAVAEVRPRPRTILSRLGGVPCLKLALWPTVPAKEAVVRRRPTCATRQRTIEANGIDCGPVVRGEGQAAGTAGCQVRATLCSGCSFLPGDEIGVLSKEPGAPTGRSQGDRPGNPGRSRLQELRVAQPLRRAAGELRFGSAKAPRRLRRPDPARPTFCLSPATTSSNPGCLSPWILEASLHLVGPLRVLAAVVGPLSGRVDRAPSAVRVPPRVSPAAPWPRKACVAGALAS
jgi:hypothetical protein